MQLDFISGERVLTFLFFFECIFLASRYVTAVDEFQTDLKEVSFRNLQGKPGEGYYVEVLIGKPPQKVRF